MVREIITLQIGGTGQQIGLPFWKNLTREHGVAACEIIPSSRSPVEIKGDASVFFSHLKSDEYVPRAIHCDLATTSGLDPATDCLVPCKARIISHEGSENCYARAFHTTGPIVAQKALNYFRKELEMCDCLQGVQFMHSLSGGTGSGLTGLLIKSISEYLDCGAKCILYSSCLVPSPSHNHLVLESFNSALSFQDLTEYCHMVLPFDSDALHSLTPNAKNPFGVVASCLSAITSSLRFPGSLSADLRKIHANVVPFKNTHFLLSSYAASRRPLSALELVQAALSPDAVTLSCNPQIERIDSVQGSRYLASFLAYSGASLSPSEVDFATQTLQKSDSRFDPFFPDWIPNSVSASISSNGKAPSLACITNNTCIHSLFDRITNSFDRQLKAKSYVYLYEESGIHSEELVRACLSLVLLWN